MSRKLIVLLSVIIFGFANCSSQQSKEQVIMSERKKINREPAVAGSFYPGNKIDLERMLKGLFEKAKPFQGTEHIRAIISPHAGYVFSGKTAASGFNQISKAIKYENIFVIASSHRVSFKGASIYKIGNYKTPLGEAKVNISLANKLINDNDIFTYYPEAHTSEHSLEVQIPFLQFLYKENLRIIPIVIGTQDPEQCKNIAKVLKPWFNEKNLFVISSDFSHFPSYEDANQLDKLTAEAIISNKPSELINAIQSVPDKPVSGLSTRLCGWSSVLTMLYITEKLDVGIDLIEYTNSGDASIGDKQRVVGYNSLIIREITKDNKSFSKSKKTSEFVLTEKDKEELIKIARETLKNHLSKSSDYKPDTKNYSKNLLSHCGAFVTLHKDDKLRGCIGRFEPGIPLYQVVQQMAIAAAVKDRRFPPVTNEELKDVEIEISVLTPLKKINSIEEFEIKKHGIYIKKGSASGTFLPQVAKETGWNTEELLGHCARDKAGIGWNGWKNAELYIYEAIIFDENEKYD